MAKSFNLPAGLSVKDPRVAMRAIIGVLLAANLVAAIIAFKPFGGSADDLRHDQQALTAQLTKAQQQVAQSKQLVDKVQRARSEGDEFLTKYFTDEASTASTILTELDSLRKEAGIKMGQATFTKEPIEGSDTFQTLSWNIGFEGNYANLTKFVNLLDKSPRFMIIDTLQAAAPQQQGGQALNVALKIDTYVRESAGATP